MKKIGRVIHITPSKKAVVKAENLPKIGDIVVDEKRNSVGEVLDIFGSTSSPYVEVIPEVKNPYELVDDFLYVLSHTGAEEKRKRGKNR